MASRPLYVSCSVWASFCLNSVTLGIQAVMSFLLCLHTLFHVFWRTKSWHARERSFKPRAFETLTWNVLQGHERRDWSYQPGQQPLPHLASVDQSHKAVSLCSRKQTLKLLHVWFNPASMKVLLSHDMCFTVHPLILHITALSNKCLLCWTRFVNNWRRASLAASPFQNLANLTELWVMCPHFNRRWWALASAIIQCGKLR